MTMGFKAPLIKRLMRVGIAFCMVQPAGNKPLEHNNNSTVDMYVGSGCPRPDIKHGFAGHLVAGEEIFKDHYNDGDSLDIYCDVNYRLEGPDSLVCDSNDWSGSPRCVAMGFCSKLPDIANGFVHQPDRAEPDSNATFSCEPGYKLTNNKTVMCVSEEGNYWTWSTTSIPSCVQEQEAANSDTKLEENTVNNTCNSTIIINTLIFFLFIFAVICICLGSYIIYDKKIRKNVMNGELRVEICQLKAKINKLVDENKKILTEKDDLMIQNNRFNEATRQNLAQPPDVDLEAPPSQEETTVVNPTDSGDNVAEVRTPTSIPESISNDDSFKNLRRRPE